MTDDAGRAPLVELTYTSFDSPTTQRGGWQVKEVRFGAEVQPSDRERHQQMLADRIRTFLNSLEQVPKFPSGSDLARRVHRLVYRPLDRDLGGLWHTVEAGVDGTGRPGNVFVHAVLLNRSTLGLRSIDFWRSTSWLAPYGPKSVAEAELAPEGNFAPGPVRTSDELARFVNGADAPPQRIAVLGALLDAVAHTRDGGARGVVLLADSPEEAARWFDVVSHWTSFGVANDISWSTFERAEDLATPAVEGLVIAAVPSQDRAAVLVGDHGRLVIDPHREEFADVAFDPDMPWDYAGDRNFPKTPWSGMVMNTFASPGAPAVALDALNSVGAAVDLGVPEAPHAALADFLFDQKSEDYKWAKPVADAAYGPTALSCRKRMVGEAEAWAYMKAAMEDHDWLCGPQPPPADPAALEMTPDRAEVVVGRIDAVSQDLRSARTEMGPLQGWSREQRSADVQRPVVLALRLMDFLVRLGFDKYELVSQRLAELGELTVGILQGSSEEVQNQIAHTANSLDDRTKKRYVVRRLENPTQSGAVPTATPESAGPPIARTAPADHRASHAPHSDVPGAEADPAWVARALLWGDIGEKVPYDVDRGARETLDSLGLLSDPLFMASRETGLRPGKEVTALAIIASLRLPVFERAAKDRGSEPFTAWTHLTQTARRLLDMGQAAAVRTRAIAAVLVRQLVEVEVAKKNVAPKPDASESYRRLLGALAAADELGPRRLRDDVAFLKDDDQRVSSEALRCVADQLGMPFPERKKGLFGR